MVADDPVYVDYETVPLVGAIISVLNCCIAFGMLGYFTHKLHRSERYQQVPVVDEDDEEIS